MKKNNIILSIIIVFVVITGAAYGLCQYAPAYNFKVLMAGNGIMGIVSLLSYTLVRRQIQSRPQAFVRGVSGASLLKLMICMVALLAYLLIDREHIYKPTIFILFGIYIVYTAVETIQLSKMARS